MSDSGGDADVGPLVADLVATLRELEAEFEPTTESGLPRPPSPRELMRFTSDVAIPGAILILRTNIEALRLLRRALRMADGRPPTTGATGDVVRERAERLSAATLSKLDGALADLQDAVEGVPEHDETRDLLAEARELRGDVQEKLQQSTADESSADDAGADDAAPVAADAATTDDLDDDPLAPTRDVPVDVDAELQSLKEQVDGDDQFPDGRDGSTDGDDGADPTGDGGASSDSDGGTSSDGDDGSDSTGQGE